MTPKQRRYHSERMRRLNADPSFQARCALGRRVTARAKSFRVPADKEEHYWLIIRKHFSAPEAARLLKLT